MENLPDFDTITTNLSQWADWTLRVEFPIPDAALVVAFVLALYAVRLSASAAKDSVRDEVEQLYQAELLQANRKIQQAKAELRKAQLEIERERQKRRRDTIRGATGARRAPTPRLVETPKTLERV
ncbi:hypothetical protein [Yoonia litorea]|uniref:Uncharacterized protein n=1 Tax=Yoonia litorea TaxID=1123755 RepID=A0A1I6MI17_9RHOB|nr:hypothetical protein [Yoonia litorea]SFS15303.1 hypothetical protein SAMN05444714_1838 [Yoonia litorea]